MSDLVTASKSDLAALESSTRSGPITHLPVWPLLSADRVEGGLRQLLAETESGFDAHLNTGHSPSFVGNQD